MTEKPKPIRGVESSVLDRVLSLYDSLLHDLGANPKSIETVARRGRAEGLSFFTRHLPDLGNKFFAFLETKAPVFDGWKCDELGYPVFLSEFISPAILENPSSLGTAQAVRAVRQICYFAYKAEDGSGISDDSVAKAVSGYRLTESTLPKKFDWDPILAACAYLAEEVFKGFSWDELRCSNGPGTVADCSFTSKFGSNLEPSAFSVVNNQLYANADHLSYNLGGKVAAFDNLSYGRSIQVSEFRCVPKDSRGPRTICRETTVLQFAQQGLRRFMERRIVKASTLNGVSRVNFSDQSVNSSKALEASRSRDYATLDLKDASDRLTFALAEKIFQRSELWEALMATRSTHVVFPDGDTLELRKFAPMGSAVCFTTLSFVIWALLTCSFRLIGRDDLADEVYVYGDDVVVPRECFSHSCSILQTYALKVNVSKSFASSYFRESCGMDAYAGLDVTPIRLRFFPSTQHCDGVEIASLADTVHQLWRNGLFLTAMTLSTWLPELPPGDGDESYITLPVELKGATKRSYWLDKGKTVRLDGVGRPYVKAAVTEITVDEGRVLESDLDFFYRAITPRIGAGTAVFPLVEDLPSLPSPKKGVVDLPRRTRLQLLKKRIYL